MTRTAVAHFVHSQPSDLAWWRGIILFGQNSASYKFALGKSLLSLAQEGRTRLTLDELAVPFSRHICDHLKTGKKQGTSKSSKFLDICRQFNAGEITVEQLQRGTAQYGFENVIDAFHKLKGENSDQAQFYIDERNSGGGIQLTDSIHQLAHSPQLKNLESEIESRWNLVEHAWSLGINQKNLRLVETDLEVEQLFVIDKTRRIDMSSIRGAISGYQRGKCFYCDEDMTGPTAVDHVVAHYLMARGHAGGLNLDGVWNLVLTCQDCNSSKSSRRPHERYMAKLLQRNEYYIGSHHPLRETLIHHMGKSEVERKRFLQAAYEIFPPGDAWSPPSS